MSATTTSCAPAASSSRSTAVPAAPAPDSTIRTSSMRLPTTRSAFVSAATTTIAVPCWSSWNTGMSRRSRSRRSTSKHRGALMSSRLMPANTGAIAHTVSTIWSTSVVSSAIGNASMSANCLNRTALPSMTGSAASGPTSPRPSTAVPSVTTAIVLRLIVSRRASSGRAAIASLIRATPGVYAIDRSSRLRRGTFGVISSLPPRCMRNVRSLTRSTRTPCEPSSAATICAACASPSVAHVTSTCICSWPEAVTSSAVTMPPACSIAVVSSLTAVGRAATCRRTVMDDDTLGPAMPSVCRAAPRRARHPHLASRGTVAG